MKAMFFLREKPHQYTFSERLSMLREAGFEVQEEGGAKAIAMRDGYAAVVEEHPRGDLKIGRAGLVLGQEIAELVHLGYQTIWRAPGGSEEPARAVELHTLHDFLEDLREKLDLPSLYNESLGTVNARHHYDRLQR